MLSVDKAPPKFHARHDAASRTYLYRISRRRTAFDKRLVWWIKDRLDAAAMRRAAKLFEGRHDFGSFCENPEGQGSTIVVVEKSEVLDVVEELHFRITASHFLWKMVRRLAGTLVEVGRGNLDRGGRRKAPCRTLYGPGEVDGAAFGVVSRKGSLLSVDGWNPEAYARFGNERRRPFEDLLMLVAPIPGGRAVDLGCGSGELTRVLHYRIQASETLGIDSSDAMLAKAARQARDGVRFERGDIEAFSPAGPYDLVFSNAALHWVPDHPALLVRLARTVASGGQLAFQVPDNFDHPSHKAAEEAASREPFLSALGGAAHPAPRPRAGSLRGDSRPTGLRRADRAPADLRPAPGIARGRRRVGGGVAAVGVPAKASAGALSPVRRGIPELPLPADPGRTALLLHLSANPRPGAKVALSASASLSPDRGETRVDSGRQTLTKR